MILMLLCTDYSWDKELQAYGTREVKLVPNFDVAKDVRDCDSA